MSPDRKPNLAVVDALKEASLKAFREGHSLESAVIIFQTVDVLLRMSIKAFARSRGVSNVSLNKVAEDEQSFSRLVLYFDLVCPSNILSDRLRHLNSQRNAVLHRLFYNFDSIESLRSELSEFCVEAAKLNQELRRFVGVEEAVQPGR
ncbi:MAG: hypothetical protein HY574_01495 [candidate division NC10 bacterium]|nr:hypothetical protein [candidate division NC10 bacterium]